MRERLQAGAALVAAIGSSLLAGASPAGAGTVPGAGAAWGKAEEVPGITVLNTAGDATINSVSCATPGNCTAGGPDTVNHIGGGQVFVVSETDGTWGQAQRIPGFAALNRGQDANFYSVSCASPGNCSAGGSYAPGRTLYFRSFVASQTDGAWGQAEQVPGTAEGSLQSASCTSPGDCAAGGYSNGQGYLVSQVNGRWGRAGPVPGLAGLNKDKFAVVNQVSCASPGNCGAGGFYSDGQGNYQAYVVSETNGTWGRAGEVPGTAALNHDNEAELVTLSCPAAGDCSAGGYAGQRAFVVSETNGIWGRAIVVPGLTALSTGGGAQVLSLSCAAAGQCGGGGFYTDGNGLQQAFVVSQADGTWGRAEQVPGSAVLNNDGMAAVDSVSCAGTSACSAGGYYQNTHTGESAFVAGETGRVWGAAEKVPGLAALNRGSAESIDAVSCASAGHCAGAGFYAVSRHDFEPFVVSEP